MRKIKTFALFENESAPSIYNEEEIEYIQKALEPYVEFPEFHRKNILAWKYAIGTNNYEFYLSASKDKNPLPKDEYMEYVKKVKAEDIRYPNIPPKWEFSSFVGGLVAGRDLKTLETWELSVRHMSMDRMQKIWEKPEFPCSVIYYAISRNFPGPGWVGVD